MFMQLWVKVPDFSERKNSAITLFIYLLFKYSKNKFFIWETKVSQSEVLNQVIL